MAREARKLSVSIDRAAAETYEFLSLPENFPKWASGLGASLRKAGADWIAETPEGPATVCFTERNSHGVLDHAVKLPQVTMPVDDMFWGDRYGKLEDPFGHHWSIGTHKRDVTSEEMQQAMRGMAQTMKA